jgi:hypothetical protein
MGYIGPDAYKNNTAACAITVSFPASARDFILLENLTSTEWSGFGFSIFSANPILNTVPDKKHPDTVSVSITISSDVHRTDGCSEPRNTSEPQAPPAQYQLL